MTVPGSSVDHVGIRIPGECDQALDILFDGHRVFTVSADRLDVQDGRYKKLHWPPPVVPFLRGHAEVVVRDHVTGRTWVQEQVAFDESDEPVRVADAEGYPLAVDKWGVLVRTFGSSDSRLSGELIQDLDALLSLLKDGFGVDAFLAYGTLLGAVRGGTFIAHDNDADISYLSRFETPSDIARESFSMQRWLVERGWHVSRSTAGFLQVWSHEGADAQRKIDIFTSYFCGDHFAVERWVRARLARADLVPLGEVVLDGVTFPAPARPEALLAATYGEGWRVPDPAFAFRPPRSTSARAEGWFGEQWANRWRWNQQADETPPAALEGSGFARWVEDQLDPDDVVIEIGCGVGGDARWLGRAGRSVTGIDYADRAVDRAQELARKVGSSAQFEMLTLYDLRGVVARTAQILTTHPASLVLYAHRLLDSVTDLGRNNLWQMARMSRGPVFISFATPFMADGTSQPLPAPCLQALDPDEIAREIEARGGDVERRELVVEDGRQVCRIATRWSG